MSIWKRISEVLAALASGEALSAVFDRLRTPPEQTVGFTIAVIALGAKMAKADGQVTRNEVAAFREVFTIAPEDEENAARVFNLARQDVAGFELYAAKIAGMFGAGAPTLVDVMEGLFHIAVSDGEFHSQEAVFLRKVADIFGVSDTCYRSLVAQFAPDADPDPYDVLKVARDAALTDIRAAWRQAVKESHPDRLAARGVPQEAIRLAEKHLIAINRAWAEINARRVA